MNIGSLLADWHLQGRKAIALLIDPEEPDNIETILDQFKNTAGPDLVLVGGSLLMHDEFSTTVQKIKAAAPCPVIIFPGSPYQISEHADAILFLSLISGRDPDMLIGRQVISAPKIKALGLEAIPTGYMLIDGGKPTAVSYMSNTTPIPWDQDDIAASTALAGEMLGMKTIYMDAGSGADRCIRVSMIEKVREQVSIPIIIGGGIKDPETANLLLAAGADVVVVGNAAEKDPDLIDRVARQKTTL
jgi:putative glycerol-1-phosphate prenyltransferase